MTGPDWNDFVIFINKNQASPQGLVFLISCLLFPGSSTGRTLHCLPAMLWGS